MVCQDGFITSHAVEAVDVYRKEDVSRFLGEYTREHALIDVENPTTYGPLDLYDYYFEHKRQQVEAMTQAAKRIPEICAEFEGAFGSRQSIMEEYRMDDASFDMMRQGSTAGTAKAVIDKLRDEDVKIGLIKPRFMRPFPASRLCESLEGLEAVGVLDRSENFSTQGGPLYQELRSAVYGLENFAPRPEILSYIYGLGGREIGPQMIDQVCRDICEASGEPREEGKAQYVGVRE
jgi:pyruvate ferredoxin oxidoreductase alpha subunit